MTTNNRLREQVLRMEEVMMRTGLSRSMIYKLQAANEFPTSIKLGERAVGWIEADVDEWLDSKGTGRNIRRNLPMVYMAGRMGKPVDNKEPGREFSCWRMFDVAASSKSGELMTELGPADVLIAEPEIKTFHGTNVSFQYSGPWKARGSYHGYVHGITTCSPSSAESAAYKGALLAITRSDVFVAYLDDFEAYGTLVEIGYARALNKKIIVVTPYGAADYGRSTIENQLWFAIKAADRHIVLPDQKYDDMRECWLYAHLLIGGIISEWYPAAALQG
jgi:prophage regulatory protein